MRLDVDFSVVDRPRSSVDVKSKSTSVRATLSLGRKQSCSCLPSQSAAASNAGVAAPIGKNEILLLVSTSAELNYKNYRLKNNIEKIFDGFVGGGNCRIKLKDPPHYLCISKADPLLLRCFVMVLHRTASSDHLLKEKLLTPSYFTCSTCDHIEQLQTDLIINNYLAYSTSAEFPISLNTMSVEDCGLTYIDSRILKLRNLVFLELSKNSIRTLPDDWSSLSALVYLNLSHNHLEHLPPTFLSNVSNTLCHLDVSHNMLSHVPYRITRLSSLISLDISHNILLCLPPNIHHLSQLKTLLLSHNRLTRLPATITQLCLDVLDVSHNSFNPLSSKNIKESEWELTKSVAMQAINDEERQFFPRNPPATDARVPSVTAGEDELLSVFIEHKQRFDTARSNLTEAVDEAKNPTSGLKFAHIITEDKLTVPTLAECAGRIVVKDWISYTQADIGTVLYDYLESSKVCLECTEYCFTSLATGISFVESDRFAVQSTFDIDVQDNRVPCDVFFCSRNCLHAFVSDQDEYMD